MTSMCWSRFVEGDLVYCNRQVGEGFWAVVVDGPKFKKVEYWPGEFPDEEMGPGFDFLTMGWEVYSHQTGRRFVSNSCVTDSPDAIGVEQHPLVNIPHTCDIVGLCTPTPAQQRP